MRPHDCRESEDDFGDGELVREQSPPQPVVGDPVNNPTHYKALIPEPIEVIESWGLGFCLGNAVKYIARAGRKGDALEDLQKAAWYLRREIERLNVEQLRANHAGAAPQDR